jgi:hypothetical protein
MARPANERHETAIRGVTSLAERVAARAASRSRVNQLPQCRCILRFAVSPLASPG